MPSIRFQFDEQFPVAVVTGLRRRGIDVMTTVEAGLLGASDIEQLAHAYSDGRVMVTHDSDFLDLHYQGHPHAGIAYCEQSLRSIGGLIDALRLIYEALEPADMVGQIEFL